MTTSSRSDLLLHPVRLRILLALTGEELTTADLQGRLRDVPQATLYRQVGRLVDGGVIEIASEERIRGGVERRLRIAEGQDFLGPEDAAAMTAEQHLEGFITFSGLMIDAFGRYLDHPDADLSSDPVGYRQAALWLTDEEAAAMVDELRAVLVRYLACEPRDDRGRITLSTVLIPDPWAGPAAT